MDPHAINTMTAALPLYQPSLARVPKVPQKSNTLQRINESRSHARLSTFTVRPSYTACCIFIRLQVLPAVGLAVGVCQNAASAIWPYRCGRRLPSPGRTADVRSSLYISTFVSAAVRPEPRAATWLSGKGGQRF
jgi:hypothetical protein